MCVLRKKGVVQEGLRRGNALGFPTANVAVPGLDLSGTYAGTVLVDGVCYPAAVYADPERDILEAYLLSFSGDIYGKTVEVELREKVADSVVFDSDEQLKEYIKQTILSVKSYF